VGKLPTAPTLDAAPRAAHSGASRLQADGVPSLKSRWERHQQRIDFAALRLVAAAIAALPLETASALSGRCWRLVAPRMKRHRRALRNLALAYPEMAEAERRRIALAMWDNLGRTFAEFFHIPRIIAEDRIAFETLERFEAMGVGGPCVVCGEHLGNWEILAYSGVRFGMPYSGVYRNLSNPMVDKWVLEKRAPLYPGGLYSKSPTTARALLRIAREGGHPAFFADQRAGNGIAVPFFGRPATSVTFPAVIARTVGIPLYAGRVLRRPGVRFTIRVEPVEVPRTADREADIRVATANLQARIEEFVREAPEQWMWAHGRWD
jgi:Kdo2-lipid IVA lauroyltransferase/acyltransferase